MHFHFVDDVIIRDAELTLRILCARCIGVEHRGLHAPKIDHRLRSAVNLGLGGVPRILERLVRADRQTAATTRENEDLRHLGR